MEENLADILLESIACIDEDILELQEQRKLVGSLNLAEPVSRESWRKLCLTPLRGTRVLVYILQRMFPDGKDFNQGANSITFSLYGWEFHIPTSQQPYATVNMESYLSSEMWLSHHSIESPSIPDSLDKNQRELYYYYDSLPGKAKWLIYRQALRACNLSEHIIYPIQWLLYRLYLKRYLASKHEEFRKDVEYKIMLAKEDCRLNREFLKNHKASLDNLFNKAIPQIQKLYPEIRQDGIITLRGDVLVNAAKKYDYPITFSKREEDSCDN